MARKKCGFIKRLFGMCPQKKRGLGASSIESSIRSLRVGERTNFGNFWVKKKSRGEYVLFDNRVDERARFGTLKQILEDAQFAVDNGVLPPPSGQRW